MIYHYPKNPTVKITHFRYEATFAGLSPNLSYRFHDGKILSNEQWNASYDEEDVILFWKVQVWFKWQDSSLSKPIDFDYSKDYPEKTFSFTAECRKPNIYEKVTTALACVEAQLNTRASESWQTYSAPWNSNVNPGEMPYIQVQDVKPES